MAGREEIKARLNVLDIQMKAIVGGIFTLFVGYALNPRFAGSFVIGIIESLFGEISSLWKTFLSTAISFVFVAIVIAFLIKFFVGWKEEYLKLAKELDIS